MLAHRSRCRTGIEPAAARALLDPAQRVHLASRSHTHMTAGRDGNLGGSHFGRHPSGTHRRACTPGHPFDLRGDATDFGNELRVRIARGIRRVQPIHVGQQHQAIRTHHLRDARRQPIIVAIADLGSRHGIVFVDDRDGAQAQQRAERTAGIEIATPLFGIAERQKDLRHCVPMSFQHVLPCVRQADLAHGGSRLAFFELEFAGLQTQLPAPQRDRARGDEQHVLTAHTQCMDITRQRFQPGAVELAGLRIHEERRADFDDHAASGNKGRCGGAVHVHCVQPIKVGRESLIVLDRQEQFKIMDPNAPGREGAAVYQLSKNSFTEQHCALEAASLRCGSKFRLPIFPHRRHVACTRHPARIVLGSVACRRSDPLIFRGRSACGFWRRSSRFFSV